MQRIFDVENKEDMDLLWSILPDDVVRILKSCHTSEKYYGENNNVVGITNFFNINWHDKTEITRPVNYDNIIGCVCWFWDGEQKPARPVLSVLWRYDDGRFWTVRRVPFEHFMTVQKSELKFYEDK